jgi:cytoskeletal protein RodZ
MAEIAEELCLSPQYLRAIEENDLKNLPGIFFYKSFVRQYAAALGVDPAQLRSGIEALTPSDDGPPAPPVNAPTPLVTATNRRYFSDRSLGTSVAGLVGVVVACSVFYSWWERPKHPTVIQQPVAPVQVLITQQPVQVAPAQAMSVPTITTMPDADVVNRVALNLSATEKTWLSISSGGKQIFSGILEPSQTKTLTGLDAAHMKVGNAGGIEVQWNGKAIGPIGPRGQVRVVEFTPDHFEILPTNPAPPEETL